jgi:hypothetical protein
MIIEKRHKYRRRVMSIYRCVLCEEYKNDKVDGWNPMPNGEYGKVCDECIIHEEDTFEDCMDLEEILEQFGIKERE